jgi:hypothetical protein
MQNVTAIFADFLKTRYPNKPDFKDFSQCTEL